MIFVPIALLEGLSHCGVLAQDKRAFDM